MAYVAEHSSNTPHNDELKVLVNGIASAGSTPLVVAENGAGSNGATEKARVLGVIELKDIVKGGMRARFDELRRMGIRTIMITGDNPLTAATIAKEAGVDDFLAQATQFLLLAPAGTVVIFNSHVWHGGTRHRTEGRRRALPSYFCRRDQPQQLDQCAYIRPETAARLSAAARYILDV